MDDYGWIEVCCVLRGPHRAHVWWTSVGPDLLKNEVGWRCEGRHACELCLVAVAEEWDVLSRKRICTSCATLKAVQTWNESSRLEFIQARARLEIQKQIKENLMLIPWLHN